MVSKPVRSVYPDVNFRFRSLLHRSIYPRASTTSDQPREDIEPLSILWSRDGNFDNRSGVMYQPNHFVPVLNEEENSKCPAKLQTTTGTVKKSKQQGTLFSFMKTKPVAKTSLDNSCPTTGPSVPAKKRNAVTTKLSKVQQDLKKSTASTKHRLLYKWKDEFPWLTIRDEDQAFLCNVCCKAPDAAGKSQFLTGCTSIKKETMQKHAASSGHLHAQTVVIAKQKPVHETVIAQSLTKGRKDQEEKDRREVAVKMTTAYFLAKEELPFSKFQGLINLQKNNGLEIMTTYANDRTCAEMVSVLGKMFKEKTAHEINQTNYISVMAD